MFKNFLMLTWWEMVYRFWRGLYNLTLKLSSYYRNKGEFFKANYIIQWGEYAFARKATKARTKFRAYVRESRSL